MQLKNTLVRNLWVVVYILREMKTCQSKWGLDRVQNAFISIKINIMALFPENPDLWEGRILGGLRDVLCAQPPRAMFYLEIRTSVFSSALMGYSFREGHILQEKWPCIPLENARLSVIHLLRFSNPKVSDPMCSLSLRSSDEKLLCSKISTFNYTLTVWFGKQRDWGKSRLHNKGNQGSTKLSILFRFR